MKKILLILSVSIILIGCSQNKKKNEYWDNGKLKKEYIYGDDGIQVGYKEYYDNGQLEIERTIPIPVREYYRTGVLKYESFTDDKGNHMIFYYEGGGRDHDRIQDSQGNCQKRSYFTNGQLRFLIKEKGDSVLSMKCWDEDGNEIDCE